MAERTKARVNIWGRGPKTEKRKILIVESALEHTFDLLDVAQWLALLRYFIKQGLKSVSAHVTETDTGGVLYKMVF